MREFDSRHGQKVDKRWGHESPRRRGNLRETSARCAATSGAWPAPDGASPDAGGRRIGPAGVRGPRAGAACSTCGMRPDRPGAALLRTACGPRVEHAAATGPLRRANRAPKDKGPSRIGWARYAWCCWSDSNTRPTDYESVALPTELQQRCRPCARVPDERRIIAARRRHANRGKASGVTRRARPATLSSPGRAHREGSLLGVRAAVATTGPGCPPR